MNPDVPDEIARLLEPSGAPVAEVVVCPRLHHGPDQVLPYPPLHRPVPQHDELLVDGGSRALGPLGLVHRRLQGPGQEVRLAGSFLRSGCVLAYTKSVQILSYSVLGDQTRPVLTPVHSVLSSHQTFSLELNQPPLKQPVLAN